MADNDTHGEAGKGWYGFDLDGTLAKYDGWRGIIHIGKPIAPMVKLIQQMHDEGKVVKIMTARVAPKAEPETGENPYTLNHLTVEAPDVQTWALKDRWGPLEYIQEWCYRNLGFVPDIVYQKDHLMLELYDDRVKQVVPNEGWLVEDIAMSKRVVRTIERVEYVNCKWGDKFVAFAFGMVAMLMLFTALTLWNARSMPEAVRNLGKAVQEYQDAQLLDTRVKDIFTKGGQ